jgi:hypothetical protein
MEMGMVLQLMSCRIVHIVVIIHRVLLLLQHVSYLDDENALSVEMNHNLIIGIVCVGGVVSN